MDLLFPVFFRKFCPVQDFSGIPHYTAPRYCPMFQIHGLKRDREVPVCASVIRCPMRDRRSLLIQRLSFFAADTTRSIQLCRIQGKSRSSNRRFSTCRILSVLQTIFFHFHPRMIFLHLIPLNFRTFFYHDRQRIMGNKA